MATEKKPAHEVLLDELELMEKEIKYDKGSNFFRTSAMRAVSGGFLAVLAKMIMSDEDRQAVVTRLRKIKAMAGDEGISEKIIAQIACR